MTYSVVYSIFSSFFFLSVRLQSSDFWQWGCTHALRRCLSCAHSFDRLKLQSLCSWSSCTLSVIVYGCFCSLSLLIHSTWANHHNLWCWIMSTSVFSCSSSCLHFVFVLCCFVPQFSVAILFLLMKFVAHCLFHFAAFCFVKTPISLTDTLQVRSDCWKWMWGSTWCPNVVARPIWHAECCIGT